MTARVDLLTIAHNNGWTLVDSRDTYVNLRRGDDTIIIAYTANGVVSGADRNGETAPRINKKLTVMTWLTEPVIRKRRHRRTHPKLRRPRSAETTRKHRRAYTKNKKYAGRADNIWHKA